MPVPKRKQNRALFFNRTEIRSPLSRHTSSSTQGWSSSIILKAGFALFLFGMFTAYFRLLKLSNENVQFALSSGTSGIINNQNSREPERAPTPKESPVTPAEPVTPPPTPIPPPTPVPKCEIKFVNPNMALCYWHTGSFGTDLGPAVVRELLAIHFECNPTSDVPLLNFRNEEELASREICFFVIGSVFHLAKSGDHLWGVGLNPQWTKTIPAGLTVHTVRGPLTSRFLGNHNVPLKNQLFGDSSFLIPFLYQLKASREEDRICFIPNKFDVEHDLVKNAPEGVHVITTFQRWDTAVAEIQRCGYVASSDLHGLSLADALQIPRLWVLLTGSFSESQEGTFSINDYMLGIGQREVMPPVKNLDDILDKSKYPEVMSKEELAGIIKRMSTSFPFDLFDAIRP